MTDLLGDLTRTHTCGGLRAGEDILGGSACGQIDAPPGRRGVDGEDEVGLRRVGQGSAGIGKSEARRRRRWGFGLGAGVLGRWLEAE